MEIKIEKLNKSYSVKTDSNLYIGSFQLDTDGFYYFWQDTESTGCWGAWELRRIADLLDEVNKPYKESLDEYFELEQRNFEDQARVEYRQLLNSGMFWELYPTLTGNWKEDKFKWLDIFKELVDLRAQKDFF